MGTIAQPVAAAGAVAAALVVALMLGIYNASQQIALAILSFTLVGATLGLLIIAFITVANMPGEDDVDDEDGVSSDSETAVEAVATLGTTESPDLAVPLTPSFLLQFPAETQRELEITSLPSSDDLSAKDQENFEVTPVLHATVEGTDKAADTAFSADKCELPEGVLWGARSLEAITPSLPSPVRRRMRMSKEKAG